MGLTSRGLIAAGAAVAGAVAVRAATRHRALIASGPARRHSITVYRPIDEVRDGLPSALTGLGDAVDIELRPAPGDRGTEITVTPRGDGGAPPAGTVRRALRDARSLLEVGDVLLPSGPSTTKKTLANRGLRQVTRHGREGGLL